MLNYDKYDAYCDEDCKREECEHNHKIIECAKETLLAMMKRIRSEGCDPEIIESYVEDLCCDLDIQFPRHGILPRKVI